MFVTLFTFFTLGCAVFMLCNFYEDFQDFPLNGDMIVGNQVRNHLKGKDSEQELGHEDYCK